MKQLILTLVALLYFSPLFSKESGATGCNEIVLDTTYLSYPAQLPEWVSRRHVYHQTLALKLMMSQGLFDGKFKRRDNGESAVELTCEQTLEVIKKIDNLTLGIPKIIYLVGWQYNGHDSKYPAWFEGNERLKRSCDNDAMESLRWLMEAAQAYNTTLSLHINMFDAYEDSPLWETYVANNIIARRADGSLLGGEWGYPISYAQEWKTGYTQQRIDSLCQLLPIQQAGTIHIDAFHTWPPIPIIREDGSFGAELGRSATSPYLDFTVEDETETQHHIFKYWASKGIDVTSEGVDFLRQTSFEGYQPMAWWFNGLNNYLRWPASYYCGGVDNSEWGKLFGTSMHGEDVVRKDAEKLTGFKEQFCNKTLIWYFLNRLDRQYILNGNEYKAVQFSDNIRTCIFNKEFTLKKGDISLVENDNVFMPALWLKRPSVIAYSKKGYKNKTWTLPDDWGKNKKIVIYEITATGKIEKDTIKIKTGQLTLSLKEDEMLLLEIQ